MSYLLDSRRAPAMVSKTIVWLLNFLQTWSYTIHNLTDEGTAYSCWYIHARTTIQSFAESCGRLTRGHPSILSMSIGCGSSSMSAKITEHMSLLR